MAASSPIVLILGAGPRVGAGVARAFRTKGYRVATSSRTAASKPESSDLHVEGDYADPTCISDIFGQVREKLGHPSVVVYNAGATHCSADRPNAFSIGLDVLMSDFHINTTSAIRAAHEAVISFGQLPAEASKTFIYTGNKTNEAPIPPLMSLGLGKTAAAYVVRFASITYADKGYKFYYADERKPDMSPGDKLDGDAHGTFYVRLSETEKQGEWSQLFVKSEL